MDDEQKKLAKIIGSVVGLIVALVLLIALMPFVSIGAGERGVVLNWGAVSDTVLGEGLHWRTPIVQKVVKIDVKMGKDVVDVGAASKDLQTVSSKIAINYHLSPEKVNKVWQEVGKDYAERIISPAIQESVKATTAKFTAEELITKREMVKDEIKLELTNRLAPRYIIVDEMNIIDFDFSNAFNSAIEAKVTAEQNALAAKNKLEQVKFEAEQAIAQAKGKAQAIQIEGDALRSTPQIVELRFLEKWNGVMPLYYGGGKDASIFIGIDK